MAMSRRGRLLAGAAVVEPPAGTWRPVAAAVRRAVRGWGVVGLAGLWGYRVMGTERWDVLPDPWAVRRLWSAAGLVPRGARLVDGGTDE